MQPSFLEHQARIGISVHLGGLPATRRLLSLCHVAQTSEVLDIGCGIGIGPAYITRTSSCRVVGVDLSSQMIDWARRRGRAEGVEDRVTYVVADMLALPFEDDRFDVVIAESVLSFVLDKERVIAEMVRVAKPGGHVGLNEGFLLTETPTPRVAELARQIGSAMVTLPAWQALWAESGLAERVVRTYRVDAAQELRDRFRWVGLPRLAAASVRAALLYLVDPEPGLCSIRCSAASVRGQTSRQGHHRPGHPSAMGCSWAASRSWRDDPPWAASLAFRPPGREAGLGPRARAAAKRGSTPAARSSSHPPWPSRPPGGASRSSATGRVGGRLPSPIRNEDRGDHPDLAVGGAPDGAGRPTRHALRTSSRGTGGSRGVALAIRKLSDR